MSRWRCAEHEHDHGSEARGAREVAIVGAGAEEARVEVVHQVGGAPVDLVAMVT